MRNTMLNLIQKTAKLFLALLLTVIMPVSSINAGSASEVTVDISLPTVQCGMCERTISSALDNAKGVKDFTVDIENKKVTVTYDDAVTTVSKIEKAITKVGYAANDRKANKKAYDNLHSCCKLPEDR